MTEAVTKCRLSDDDRYFQEAIKRWRHIWEFLADPLGVSHDDLIRIKHGPSVYNKSYQLFNIARQHHHSIKRIREKISRWAISDAQIDKLAEKFNPNQLNKLVRIVDMDPSKIVGFPHLLKCMRNRGLLKSDSYTWNIINELIDDASKKPKLNPDPTMNDPSPMHSNNLDKDDTIAQLQTEIAQLQKNVQMIQETLDSLIVEIRYRTPPEQNPVGGNSNNRGYVPRLF